MKITITFGVALIALGLLLTVNALQNLRISTASGDWPVVEGKVISSETLAREATAEKQRRYTTYNARVAYSYTVSGKEYIGHKVFIDSQGKTFSSKAEEIVKKYPAGSTVKVSYDPSDPSQAILEPKRNSQTYGTLIIGLAMLVMGFGMASGYLRPRAG